MVSKFRLSLSYSGEFGVKRLYPEKGDRSQESLLDYHRGRGGAKPHDTGKVRAP